VMASHLSRAGRRDEKDPALGCSKPAPRTRVRMASDVFPDPDTPTTATIRHSGTPTSLNSDR